MLLEWLDATQAATAGADRDWALSWGAAANAVAQIPPGFDESSRLVCVIASLATAVSDALTTLLDGNPVAIATLDAQRSKTLGELPEGRPKTTGIQLGAASATSKIAEREGDGWTEETFEQTFPTPEPAPGVWQPTPTKFLPASLSALGGVRTYIIDDLVDRVVPPRPPALESREMIADLEEVLEVGALNSSSRTQEQTDVASFWTGPSHDLYFPVLRALIAESANSVEETVARVATYYATTTDSYIATYAWKYRYLRWRPVTALRYEDDNPLTPYSPEFLPTFTSTPTTPDYPSGHCTYAGTAEVLLNVLFGTKTSAPVSVTYDGITRVYSNWLQMTQENIDGRVWSGYHFRGTDIRSAQFGRAIAAAGLASAG
ncbi:MAG: vanadium-dependent haloperoxidase [Dermatophilaceae bacterium]